jgi:hypothetical protein
VVGVGERDVQVVSLRSQRPRGPSTRCAVSISSCGTPRPPRPRRPR